MDASPPCRLDGWGPGELWAESRDTVPGCEAGGPVPDQVLADSARARTPHQGRTAAVGSLGAVHCFKIWCKLFISLKI